METPFVKRGRVFFVRSDCWRIVHLCSHSMVAWWLGLLQKRTIEWPVMTQHLSSCFKGDWNHWRKHLSLGPRKTTTADGFGGFNPAWKTLFQPGTLSLRSSGAWSMATGWNHQTTFMWVEPMVKGHEGLVHQQPPMEYCDPHFSR